MKKIFLIGWKDVLIAFRDPAALILMLAAPFLLTLGLGAVTGRVTSSASTINSIPVVLVNQDGDQIGNALVALFQSTELKDLVIPTLLTDPRIARQMVDQDKAAAAILIPAGFSLSIIPSNPPSATDSSSQVVTITLYTNPTRPTSSGVVKTIVDQFMSQVEVGRVGGEVAVGQLIASGLIQPQRAAQVGQVIGVNQAVASSVSVISIKNTTASGKAVKFDILALLAPGMALMFLMYTTSHGGRSLLTERAMGTLPRLLVTPTSITQVLGGKIFGIYLTGVLQMLILVGASTLLFKLDWGDPLGVVVLLLAAVAGAVGWGLIISALARTPGQVNAIGSAIMLTFGILGGTFINMAQFPAWFSVLTHISPNAWGVDAFNVLAQGGGLMDIANQVAALFLMGAILFTAAVLILRRRNIAQG
jgi:ABC-2 type transport system permease protein